MPRPLSGPYRPHLPPLHRLLELLHPVESGAGPEPLELRLVEGVVQSDGLMAAIAVLECCRQGLEVGHRR